MFKKTAAITTAMLFTMMTGSAFGQPIKDLVDNVDELRSLVEAKTIFVTSTPTMGDIGGLEGADAFCQVLADTPGSIVPAGEYVALLSTDTVNASARISPSIGPYIRPDGAFVAANAAALFNTFSGSGDAPPGRLINMVDIDETGADTNAFKVWTGSGASGTLIPGGTLQCSGWEDGSSQLNGWAGDPSSRDGSWLSDSFEPCHTPRMHLYCVMR